MAYSDRRTPAQHDCDRILYSTAFRRLAGVTQVVSVRERQLFHNRLTHTLKVAQLAERLAQVFGPANPDYADFADEKRPDPDVARAAGLAHDLGHPPFGHIGEDELRSKCEEYLLEGYEGNAQAFRIVTRLAQRNQDEPGLSLSNPTLNAILKYPYLREGKHAKYLKWGCYASERKYFSAVRKGWPGEQRSVEAEIMDWCDDVAYAVHDVEDFFRAGMIPLHRLTDSGEFEEFLARVAAELGKRMVAYDPEEGARALRGLRDLLIPDSPWEGTEQHRRALHRMTNTLITRYMGAVTLHDTEPPTITINRKMRHEVQVLKQLTWQYVVNNPSLATLQVGQASLLRELFDELVCWVAREEEAKTTYRLPNRLWDLYVAINDDGDTTAEIKKLIRAKSPKKKSGKGGAAKAQAVFEESSIKNAYRARAVADYIGSLTEEQTVDLHARLCGGGVQSSILEGWVAH